jgi:hypothetical protein
MLGVPFQPELGMGRACAELRRETDLAVVPGATHLFEEPGIVDAAAGLARDWFGTSRRTCTGIADRG